ncbi:hypothetical protein AB0M39_42025, partial [Streptomyces sp. NPDC051907]|uniref:hypothetical protein n=1 Tax=Streptomyces sp. NPDC051907 TaxID=3155284 RepID=UPI00343970DD
MKTSIDLEFREDGTVIELVSIALVAEDGRELYAVNADMDQHAVRTHPWLGRNVWPQLPVVKNPRGARGVDRLDLDHPDVHPRRKIRRMAEEFFKATPDLDLWAYYGAYDHVCMAQLWGPMPALPSYVPMRTNDIAQELARLGDPPVPAQPEGEHHP